MEENKNPLMGHVVKVPAQVSGIPDGVQMTVNAAVTTFAAVETGWHRKHGYGRMQYACQLYAGNGLVLCPRGKARYGERPSG